MCGTELTYSYNLAATTRCVLSTRIVTWPGHFAFAIGIAERSAKMGREWNLKVRYAKWQTD